MNNNALYIEAVILQVICFAIRFTLGTSHITTLERKIFNSGFHRQLHTRIVFEDEQICKQESLKKILLEEKIPSGIYVDFYEINNLVPYGGPEVLFMNAVDVEKAEYLSSSFTLYIYLQPYCIHTSGHSEANVTLSVHLRYHRPSSDPNINYANITISSPNFYFRSNDNDDNPSERIEVQCHLSTSKLCHWRKLHPIKVPHPLVVQVPVGKMDHFYIVTCGTIITTVLGCGLIILTILKQRTPGNKQYKVS